MRRTPQLAMAHLPQLPKTHLPQLPLSDSLLYNQRCGWAPAEIAYDRKHDPATSAFGSEMSVRICTLRMRICMLIRAVAVLVMGYTARAASMSVCVPWPLQPQSSSQNAPA